MKIIRPSDEPPRSDERRAAPALAPTPAQAPAEFEENLKKDFETWKTQVLTDFHQFQAAFDAARAQETAYMSQNAAAVAQLTEEVQALRKTIVELSRVKPQTPPPAEPPTPPILKVSKENPVIEKIQPVPNPVGDALVGLSSEKPEKKVAFLTKLWDYLNQVAFEVPLRKTDRIQ